MWIRDGCKQWAKLISEDTISALKEKLFPLALILTPNIPEAEVLSGIKIKSDEDMIEAARIISDNYIVLFFAREVIIKTWPMICSMKMGLIGGLKQPINNPNTHGTGCTLSSAIASNLAKGYDLISSVGRAKDYVTGHWLPCWI